MFENLKLDYTRTSNNKPSILRFFWLFLKNAGFRAMVLYRMGNWCQKHKMRYMAVFLEKIMHHLCHCWISTRAEIGAGFWITHVGGIVIGSGTRIGNNCDIRQNTTFGGNFSKKSEDGRDKPWLENNISIGCGAAILGPVKIGSNSIVGANSVVTRDVPANHIVSGVPAKIIKERWDENSGRKL